MKRTLVAVAVLATVSCMAQDAPAAVKRAFAKQFPNTTVQKWDKEDGKYEANFTTAGKRMSATFDATGALEETETDIQAAELPSLVTSYIKTNYKGAGIKEAAIITNAKGEKMYEAEVKGKDLLFDMQGTFLREEKD